MTKKAYALKDKDGNFLFLEQIGNSMVEVSPVSDPSSAEIWEDKTNAFEVALDMINGSDKWDFEYYSCSEPVRIVELEITVKQKEIIDMTEFKQGDDSDE